MKGFISSIAPAKLITHKKQEPPHYENLPMQYTEIFKIVENENFQWKNFDIFLIFAQNIDCGYTLEPPRRGGSNEYPQSMFWSKNKKNRYTPANPSFPDDTEKTYLVCINNEQIVVCASLPRLISVIVVHA